MWDANPSGMENATPSSVAQLESPPPAKNTSVIFFVHWVDLKKKIFTLELLGLQMRGPSRLLVLREEFLRQCPT